MTVNFTKQQMFALCELYDSYTELLETECYEDYCSTSTHQKIKRLIRNMRDAVKNSEVSV